MFANVMLGPDGLVAAWNARAQRIFGHDARAIIGHYYSSLLLMREGAEEAGRLLDSAARVGYADYTGDCARQDGSRFPVQALITSVKEDSALIGYSLVILNMTDIERAEQRQRDDAAQLLSIIQSAMDAIITVDEDQHVVLFNAAAERIFGCSAEQAIGGPLERFVPQRFRSVHRGHVERFSATGVTNRRMGDQTVLAGVRANGEEFPLEASISQVIVGGRRLFTVILRDVTERQQAAENLNQSHRQLQGLYAAMHEVREAERTRIARELHDELAQWLTALKMDASWLAARVPPGEAQFGAKLTKMKAAVDTTVAAVRRIAADLRPVMLDDLGLVPALEHLLHEFSERTGVAVGFEGNAKDSMFREPLVTAVYRMVQEALTNVARHAKAGAVELDVRTDDEQLFISVRDDGRGIRPEDLQRRESFGVLGIRERAQTLGGSAKIYSPDDGGTVVEITIPLGPHNSMEARGT